MKIDTLTDLTEARQQSMMFHGTSSTFLRPIIASGIEPEPVQKVWATDPNADTTTASRASLPGSYWTMNLMTAYSSAGRAVDKFKGERMIVIAMITESATYADEDSIRFSIEGAWDSAVAQVLRVNSLGINHTMWTWFGPPQPGYENLKQDLIDTFSKNLHEHLALSDKHPINYDLLVKMAEVIILRRFSYAWKNYQAKPSGTNPFYGWPDNVAKEVGAKIPMPDRAEQNYLAMLDKMGRTYRKTTRANNVGDTYYTTRVPDRVGYSGAHKIICIVELARDRETFKTTMKVRYGELPDRFINLYKTAMGGEFSIETKNS